MSEPAGPQASFLSRASMVIDLGLSMARPSALLQMPCKQAMCSVKARSPPHSPASSIWTCLKHAKMRAQSAHG